MSQCGTPTGKVYSFGMQTSVIGDLIKLPASERLELISELWNSLDSEHIPLTAAQRDELDRRLLTLEEDRKTGIPWEVLRHEMASRYR